MNESVCSNIAENYVPDYFYKKFISDSDTSIYHGSTADILTEINDKKSSTILFAGGATSYFFAPDSFFTINDVQSLHNDANPCFMYFFPCQRFSNDSIGSMLDACILAKTGAVSGFAAVGAIYNISIITAIEKLFSSMYSDKMTIGESWRSFLKYQHDDTYSSCVIFGDPSLKPKFSMLNATASAATPVKQYALYQNYPNPFNPSTTIKYSVADNGLVSLSIYNQLGQRVAELFHGERQSGTYSVTWNAIGFPSGVYFCELKTTHYREVKKLLLVK
jgi:hypothetical protein